MLHREDLILEISQNVREIRAQVTSLVAQGAVLTREVSDNAGGIESLNKRLTPVESDYKFIKRLAGLMLLVMGSGAISAIAGVIKVSIN